MKRLLFVPVAIFLVLVACKKDDDKNNDQGITADFYFTALIDGVEVTYEDGKNGYGSGASSGSSSALSGCQEEQGMNIRNPFIPKNLAGAVMLKVFATCSPTCTEIEPMFGVGSYTFGAYNTGSSDDGTDGVVVYYIDENGTSWSTDQGTGDQPGSSFQITEHIVNNDGYSKYISKAVFNCILYDDSGNSKVLTNGELRSRSVLCN